ncbi:MAG: hypothetical protein ABIV10_02675, partial [Gemmatimonadaceae bacterium]
AAVASCGDNIVDPTLPQGATAFTAPAVYTTWWEMTKACSSRSGSLAAISWYVVPAALPLALDGQSVSAYWSAGSNQIVISAAVAEDGPVIRHEMLHALLGSKGHPREEFLGRCAGYVTCTSKCAEDAGPAPVMPTSVPRVSPTDLIVTAVIAPPPNSGLVDGNYFAIVVRARNPFGYTVAAALPTSAVLPDAKISFAYTITGVGGESAQIYAFDGSASTFAAGETKTHVFDFFVGDGFRQGRIFTGPYTANVGYGGNFAPQLTFTTR